MMNRPIHTLSMSILASLILLSNASFAEEPASSGDQTIAIPAAMQPNMNITTVPLQFTQQLPITRGIVHISASASALAGESASAQVSSPADGQIIGAVPQIGETVKAGQPLIEIASPQLAQDQAQWAMANAQATVARQDLSRDQSLFADGLIAKKRLEATRANTRTAEATLQAAAERMRLAGITNPDKTKSSQTAKLTIAATIDGVITQRKVITGERVTAGQSLLEITAQNHQWWLMAVPPAQAPAADAQAELRISGCSEPAPVRLIDLTVDPASQMITLRAQPKVACMALRPGQISTATLWVHSTKTFFAVPIISLTEMDNRTQIIVHRDGQYRPVPVTQHGEADGMAYVTGPLQPKDQVVTAGISRLKALAQGMGTE
ncbi:MAG: efflux RND transporter periplasmic adaptor subunit [Halothiobacillus sp.]|jgi:cobalt-zinc-cadmium efflux system membrane fusion protein|nr:efflux RND transporter periplasmic adaptor subunit [Halothiobacillus sp.]